MFSPQEPLDQRSRTRRLSTPWFVPSSPFELLRPTCGTFILPDPAVPRCFADRTMLTAERLGVADHHRQRYSQCDGSLYRAGHETCSFVPAFIRIRDNGRLPFLAAVKDIPDAYFRASPAAVAEIGVNDRWHTLSCHCTCGENPTREPFRRITP